MNILIFGGHTTLGKRLAFYLNGWAEEQKKAVTVASTTEYPLSLEEIQKAIWETYVGARTEPGRPTLIINAYETSELRACQYDPGHAFTENSTSAAHIALAARAAQIPLVQISSDMVFSDGPAEPSYEPSPLNVYGLSKMYAENAVQTLYPLDVTGEHHYGTTIIRLSTLYGFDYTTPASSASQGVGAVASREKTSLSFVGEAAFLIARNIIDSPQLLAQPIIHVTAIDPPITWSYLIKEVGGLDNSVRYAGRSAAVPTPILGGLQPTPGWMLSKGYTKQWEDFIRESKLGRYLVYW